MITYKEFDVGYRVGDDGSIWSRKNNKWGLCDIWRKLKPIDVIATKRNGYTRHQVCISGKRMYIHTIVLENFIGPRPEGYEACHIDGDPTNNTPSNLYWGTRAENMSDMARHGKKKGVNHHRAKLNDEIVRNIRNRANEGETHQSIANSIGVKREAVTKIVNKIRWRHVT